MRTIKLMSVTMAFFIIVAASGFDAPTPFFTWHHELTDINSISQLEDSLASKRMPTRASAVLRLTELGNLSSVPALIKAYKTEPIIQTGIIDAGPGLKYLILRALGKIGGIDSYSFLKRLQYDIVGQPDKIWHTEGDASYIVRGLYDALANLEPADSAKIYYWVYQKEDLNQFLRQVAFESYERINLKGPAFTNYQDSLYYLLNESKRIHVLNQLDANYKETPEFIARKAIRYLIEIYSSENPEIVERYKANLLVGDPFNDEVNYLISLMRSKTVNQPKELQK